MIAENERLRQDLALEVAKSREAMRQDPERPPRAGGQRARARPEDTNSDSNSLTTELNKKGRSETPSYSEKSLHTRNKRRRSSSDEEDQHDPFVRRIARATLSKKFKAPSFTFYDGKSDPTDHIRHYKQAMTLHADNEALMCRIFPNSLGPLAVRWYYKLELASIKSFYQLQKSFRARFITNEVQPKQADSLWAMQIQSGETLRAYSARYWKCFNLVDDACNDSMAITTFKMGLHPDSPLRSSLTRRPPKTVWALMKKIEEYCKVEDDALRIKAGQMSNKTAPLKLLNQ
ncbi:hypothetical protein HYC85_030572 [Camellia sinensis]|uniref:Retrotransposon gag domain-containing protein n=1 Tax=Camellia sinensis TaxID=4442 RepID=A0A7J7G2T1_CAMSI|nr:hypothetical protein HYC85_030572 [Camellia sinensis]